MLLPSPCRLLSPTWKIRTPMSECCSWIIVQTLGLNRSLCSWILDFLTGRSQVVRMGNNTSSALTLNSGAPQVHASFYTCTVESILTGCITAWFGNSTAGNRRALQRVVRTACHIVGGELPSLHDILTRRCTRKARRIIKDSSHPSHRLLSLLPSGRRFRSIRSRTSRLRDSFSPQAIRLMNSQK